MFLIAIAERISVSSELPSFDGVSFISRALQEGESTFGPRYGVVEGQIVDKFPGKSDAEVEALVAESATKSAEILASKTEVSPVEFKLLFTPQERIALRVARESDPVLQDFFDIAEDPRLTKVELTLESTVMALDYMVSKGLLSSERASKIKLGQRP
jgi:hypothetical protein